MRYDDWKAYNPSDRYLGRPTAACDCCGKVRELSRVWPFGCECWACDECRDMEE